MSQASGADPEGQELHQQLRRLQAQMSETRAWCASLEQQQAQLAAALEQHCTDRRMPSRAAIQQMLDALEGLEECGDGGEEIDIAGRGQEGLLTSKLCASMTQAACLWEPPHGIPPTFVAYANLIPPVGVNDA